MDDAVRLEHLAHQLEQDGDDMKAIRLMERAAAIRGEASDPDTCLAMERLVIKYNTVAVRSFKADDYETATALLANAQNLTEPSRRYFDTAPELRLRLRGTTFNNLGCLERRRGRLEPAAKYLRLSLEHDGNQSAVTYVNLGAIYSQMRRPEEAVACSRRAIGLLSAPGNAASTQNPGLNAVAHHNLAMALESLDPDACLSAYETALNIAKAQLGPTSVTTVSIKRNYERFSSRMGARGAASASPHAPPSQTFLPPLATRSQPRTTSSQRPVGSSTRGTTSQQQTSPRSTRGAHGAKAATPRERGTAQRGGGRTSTAPGTSRPAPPQTDRKPPPRRVDRDAKPAKGFAHDSGSESFSDREPTPPPPQRKSSTALKASSSQVTKSGSLAPQSSQQQQAPRPPTQPREENERGGRSGAGGGRLRHLDADEERRKDDVIAFMVSRLGALLRAEEEYEQRYAAAVRIQCLARGIAARGLAERRRVTRSQAVAFQELRERKAAQALVDFFRALVNRRKAALEAAAEEQAAARRRDAAAVKIQAIARRWLAKRLVRHLRGYYREYTKALRKLQCWFRVELAKSRVHKMRLVERDSAAQKLVVERSNFAATQIQRSYRAFTAIRATAARKSTLRAARDRDRESNRTHSSKRLQAFWRRIEGERTAQARRNDTNDDIALRERAELRADAALRIQAVARGWASRRSAEDVVAAVRAHRARAAANRRERAARTVQCGIRRALSSMRVKDLKYERHLGFILQRQLFAAPIITAFVQALPGLYDFAARLDAKFPPPPPPPADEEPSSPDNADAGDFDRRGATPPGEVTVTDLTPLASADDVTGKRVAADADDRPPSRDEAHRPAAMETAAVESPATASDSPPKDAGTFDVDDTTATPPGEVVLTDLTPLSAATRQREQERQRATVDDDENARPPSRDSHRRPVASMDSAAVASPASPDSVAPGAEDFDQDGATPPGEVIVTDLTPISAAAAARRRDQDQPSSRPPSRDEPRQMVYDADEDTADSEPYVVPPRVPTPAKLKLSVAYLEERRKRELAERQRRRLAEYDPTLRPAHEVEEDEYQREREAQRAAVREQTQRVHNTAARRLQAFFRSVLDRALFNEKRAVVTEYIEALVETHRNPPHQPRQPPPRKPAAPGDQKPKTGRPAPKSAPRRDSFTTLSEVTARLGPRVDEQRQAMAVARVQAVLRCIGSRRLRDSRVGRRPVIDAAATKLTSFGRGVIGKSRVASQRSRSADQDTSRVERERDSDARMVRGASVVSAFLCASVARTEWRQRAEARIRRADSASSTLAGFAKIGSAKRSTAERHARLEALLNDQRDAELEETQQQVADEAPSAAPAAADTDLAEPAAAPAASNLGEDEAAVRIGAAARGYLGRKTSSARRRELDDRLEKARQEEERQLTAADADATGDEPPVSADADTKGFATETADDAAAAAPQEVEKDAPTGPSTDEAATRIGAAMRGYLGRKEVNARREALDTNLSARDERAATPKTPTGTPAEGAVNVADETAAAAPSPPSDATPEAAPDQPASSSAADAEREEAAATRIQCATRQRQARRRVQDKRGKKAQEWAEREAAAADETNDSEDMDKFRTPDSKRSSNVDADSPTTKEEVDAAPEVEASSSSSKPAKQDDAVPSPAEDAVGDEGQQREAAEVIQRGFRVHAAKKEADRRREVAQERWAERQRQVAAEEADMSL